jgi:prepilin peptidase CpaA
MTIPWIGDFQWVIAAAQIAFLVSAAWVDVTTRLIPDRVCLSLIGVGVIGQMFVPVQLAASLAVAVILFTSLLFLHSRRMVGGGDVKLLVALAAGLPPRDVIGFLTLTALTGGVLAFTHLAMRHLPRPRIAQVGASDLRRIYAVERWRILRHAPLPYGVAIAGGGIWAVLIHTMNIGG